MVLIFQHNLSRQEQEIHRLNITPYCIFVFTPQINLVDVVVVVFISLWPLLLQTRANGTKLQVFALKLFDYEIAFSVKCDLLKKSYRFDGIFSYFSCASVLIIS